MTGIDSASRLETLLRDNWNSTNTAGHTPAFLQITNPDSKRYDFNTNPALVLIHRPVFRFEKNGIGTDGKAFRHTVRIDIRVLGKGYELAFLNIFAEVVRILDVNIKNPWAGVQELDYEDSDAQDLSDKNKGLFRIVFPVRCINYYISRTGE